MLPQWPKGFRTLFVTVMLLLCLTATGSMIWQTTLTEQLRQTQLRLDATDARLKKQQAEYEQVQQDLPTAKAELAETSPKAEAILAREKELRAQRKALRAENAELADKIVALEAELQAEPDESCYEQIVYMQENLQGLKTPLEAAKALLEQETSPSE